MALRKLKFTASCSPYNAGDIASFDEDTARKYLAAGLAVDADPKPEEPAPKPKEAPPKKRAWFTPKVSKAKSAED